MTKVLYVLKWFIILAAVFAVAFFSYLAVKIGKPLATAAESKTFEIAKGATTKQVAQGLQGEHLVGSAFLFESYIYLKGWDGRIQAGSYSLSAIMPIREIAKVLVVGRQIANEARVTIIEGWNRAEIAAALEENGVVAREAEFLRLSAAAFADDFDFLKNQPKKFAGLEGYLFPDTYVFAKGAAPEAAARKMLQNFNLKLNADMRREIDRQGKTVHEIVTLASLVEREVGRNVRKGENLSAQDLERLAQERRLVAGVFRNRLGAGLPLESDASISFLTGRRSARATLEELKIDSPYNTYKYPGLPPGPIASPSLDAILAAIYPAQTDYLYFVTAEDGTAHFAKTLPEHRANRRKYLD